MDIKCPLYDKEALNDLLAQLIKVPSIAPPGDEAPCADLLAEYLKDCPGAELSFKEIGDNRKNLTAVLKGSGEKKALLLNGHLDVVPVGELSNWTYDPFGATVKDGVMYGRGTGDMKAGLLALAAAFKLASQSSLPLKGDLVFLATCGEEVDGCGARAFVSENDMSRFMASVIAEPTGSAVVSAEKGMLWVKIISKGVTAHGSVPETGVNAIENLMAVIELIKKGFNPQSVHPTLGRTTMNLGVLKGGMEPNIVPDSAYACIDFRTVPGYDHNDVLKLVNDSIAKVNETLPHADISLEILNNRQLISTPDDHELIKTAVEINREMGLSSIIEGKVACTDGSILNTVCDTPMLIYGPGESSQAHVYDEYVTLEAFHKNIEFFYRLIASIMC